MNPFRNRHSTAATTTLNGDMYSLSHQAGSQSSSSQNGSATAASPNPNLSSSGSRRPQSSYAPSGRPHRQDELYLQDRPSPASRHFQAGPFPAVDHGSGSSTLPASLQPHVPADAGLGPAIGPSITVVPSANGGTGPRPMSHAFPPIQPGYSPPSSLQVGHAPSGSISPRHSNVSRSNTARIHNSRSDLGGQSQHSDQTESTSSTPTSHRHAVNTQYANKFLASGNPGLQSPLVLDHIRPRANSSRDDDGVVAESMPGCSNYIAPWPIFAFDWCKTPTVGFTAESGRSMGRMAIGSYLENPHNHIQILDSHLSTDSSPSGAPTMEYNRVAEAVCSYPITRILWEPPSTSKQSDLLATSGDHLRLWSLPSSTPSQTLSNTITRSSAVNQLSPSPNKLTPLALLSNSKTPEHTAPLTSLDWNLVSPKLIITSSIDTTCTIWDIPTLTAKTQLIAHDKEVFDVRFCAHSVDVFVSCGADGSVRMFDLRSLEHSTIIYEPADKLEASAQALAAPRPLLRVAASPHDTHVLATFAADSGLIRILDVRQPGQAMLELQGHKSSINSIEWSPTRRGVLASAADDCLVMTWDLLNEVGATVDVACAESRSGSEGQSCRSTISPTGQIQSGPGPQVSGSTSQSGPTGATSGPNTGTSTTVAVKGPSSYWRSEFEPVSLSWSPLSKSSPLGSEWIGVVGGKGLWSVKTC